MPTAESPSRRDASRRLIHWTAWMTPISMIVGSIANVVAIIRTIGGA